ncbi:MAG: GvpL/GvpF family gas vesicle protein [Negativicutes bacterium]
MNNRIYVYALLAGVPTDVLDWVEIDGKLEPITGVWNNNIGFAVSKSTEYTAAGAPTQDAAVKWYVKHLQVIENIHQKFTTVTAQIGTTIDSIDEIKKILMNSAPQLKQAVDAMSDKAEYDLIISWREIKKVLAAIGEEPEIKSYKMQLMKQGQINQADVLKIGEMMSGSIARKKREVQEKVTSELSRCTEKYYILDTKGDQIVANAAFLVTSEQVRQLEENLIGLVSALESIYGINELEVRLIGPLPPKNFAMIELRKITGEELLVAKKTLQISQKNITLAELKWARNLLLQSYHPDKNCEGEEQSEQKTREIIQAYRLIKAYCDNFALEYLPESSVDAYVVKVVSAADKQGR